MGGDRAVMFDGAPYETKHVTGSPSKLLRSSKSPGLSSYTEMHLLSTSLSAQGETRTDNSELVPDINLVERNQGINCLFQNRV